MKNRKFYQVLSVLVELSVAVILVFLAEDILELFIPGKKHYFLSLTIGILCFIYRCIFAGPRLMYETLYIDKRIYTEGQTEAVMSELETIMVKQYNRKSFSGKLDRQVFEDNNFKPFINNNFMNLCILMQLYLANDKKDKAVQVIEQIHTSNKFQTMRSGNQSRLVKMNTAVFYIAALDVYIELEDMEKADIYLSEAKPYLECFKNTKMSNLGSLICLVHIKYQFLKGNYVQALQWVNQYDFPKDNKNILADKYAIIAWLYYVMGNQEESDKYLGLAEENCINQWAKDKIHKDYDDMKNKQKLRRTVEEQESDKPEVLVSDR